LAAPDTVIADKVYSDIWKEFPDLMADEWKDVKILWLEPSVPVYLFSSKPIAKLEDLKGQQIRVPSKELADLMKDMGAAPAFMSAADFIVGLDKRTVDGACGLFAMIPDYKLGGKIKSVVMISLGVSVPVMVVMNKSAFNKLPADLQGVLGKTSEWGKADSVQYWSNLYDDSVAYCKNNNVDLVYPSPQERSRWVQMIQRSREKTAAELDGKGYPGTRILRFINQRIEYYENMK
jgi:TRAP-type C4-dicarboxylate transport system substrate-binding protein